MEITKHIRGSVSMKLPDTDLHKSIKRLVDLIYFYGIVWGIVVLVEFVRAV